MAVPIVTVALVAALAAAAQPAAAQSEEETSARLDTLFGQHEPYREFLVALQRAVSTGDRSAVAGMIAYPLETRIAGGAVTLREAEDVLARYDELFVPAVTAAITEQAYASLFANAEGVMIGDGAIWFAGVCPDEACAEVAIKITAINQPAGGVRERLIRDVQDELAKRVDLSDAELESMSEEFTEYYLAEVRPHLAELVRKTRVYMVGIAEPNGGTEALLLGDTARPSAWGPRNFIAVATRGTTRWSIAELTIVEHGSIGCAVEGDCRFQYSRVMLNPPTPNDDVGAFIEYAEYGVSGHTFAIEVVRWRRGEGRYAIERIESPIPLIPDRTWSK